MASAFGRGSLPLLSFRGIKLRLHWSFLALPAYIILSALSEGQPWSAIWKELAMVGIVFVCVVLHEFGHALTAQRYGVGTRDIVLLPIGGVASLERMPEEPKQEFWITLAGPLVNLAIAALAMLVMAALGLVSLVTDLLIGGPFWASLLAFVFAANMGLFLFNLVPAFPMDGGRLLRSVLAMRMRRDKATRIATTIGRILAVIIVIYAIYQGQPFLAFIGAFVYLAAGAEARQVGQREIFRGATVAEVMRTRFPALHWSMNVGQGMNELLAGGDAAAVVVDGTYVRGIVERRALIAAVEAGRAQVNIMELPPRTAQAASPADDAQVTLQRMVVERLPILHVVDGGALVGVVDPTKAAEILGLRRSTPGS